MLIEEGDRGMTRNRPQRQSEPGRPLSRRAIAIGSVLMALVGAVAVGALHHPPRRTAPPAARLETPAPHDG